MEVGLWPSGKKFKPTTFTMDKRTFIKISGLAGAGLVATPLVSTLIGCGMAPQSPGTTTPVGFTLPELGFALDALEPAVDRATMEIHHSRHHAGYVRKLNAALEGHPMQGQPLEDLLAQLKPEDTALRNNGGGHFNHALFWTILQPAASPAESTPSGPLAERLQTSFGSVEQALEELTTAATKRFGSGWAWVVQDTSNPDRLFVTSTANQDNPLMTGIVPAASQGRPLLGIDVWEHAYYLNYQNRRTDYVKALVERINWAAVAGLMA